MAETQRYAQFPATKWSVIQRAATVPSPTSRAALEELCRLYWPPLYAFLRRAGHNPEEAKDLVQGYLARLLERQDLATVSLEKGRFRSYLLSGLRNFLVSEARHDAALKRGGGVITFSLNTHDAEASCCGALADNRSPDLAFDQRWAETILDQALESLRQEYAARGKEQLYHELKAFLVAEAAEDYAALGRRLGMTPGAIAIAVHRLRLRLRELVRAAVAHTVGCEADLEEEMRSLLAILTE
jgi:RNA polymerase sigma factor (sigma-70 family)